MSTVMCSAEKPVVVRTTNLATKNTDSKVIDYSVREDRRWLERHQWWCLNNGREVSVSPEARAHG